jgi:CSLREA domain-containing protein
MTCVIAGVVDGSLLNRGAGMQTRQLRTRVWLAAFVTLVLLLSPAPLAVAALESKYTPNHAPPIVVDTTSDSVAVDGQCSLREAITAANRAWVTDTCGAAGGFDSILLPAGTYTLGIPGASEDDNATGDLDIKAGVTIKGSGAEATIIDGAQLDRVLQVHVGTAVTIKGVTIQNGLTPAGIVSDIGSINGEDGGAIHSGGALALVECIVQSSKTGPGGNRASDEESPPSRGGRGGGIYSSGPLVLDQSIVRMNQTGDGGYDEFPVVQAPDGGNGGAGAGIYSAGSLTLTGSTVESNVTGNGGLSGQSEGYNHGGDGGGIYSAGGVLTLMASTVRANRAGSGARGGGDGGGIYSASSEATIWGSWITDNTSGGGGGVSLGGSSSFSIGGDGGDGGGIYQVGGGSLLLIESTIADNRTGTGNGSDTLHPAPDGRGGDGGGVYLEDGSAALIGSSVSENSAGNGRDGYGSSPPIRVPGAGGDGGGIYSLQGTLILSDTKVDGNRSGAGGSVQGFPQVYPQSGGDGGGICADGGNITITGSRITGNETGAGGSAQGIGLHATGWDAGDGGGLYIVSATGSEVEIDRSSIANNTAGNGGAASGGDPLLGGPGGSGGGLFVSGVALRLSQASITGNTAGLGGEAAGQPQNNGANGEGGGLFNVATVNATNVTISGNEGGGIHNAGDVQLVFGTVAGNAVYGIASVQPFVVRNTILADNALETGGVDCTGALTSEGYNVIGSTAGCTIGGDPTGNLPDVDPLLGPLADHGGGTLIHALLPSSPAIDAGTCTDMDGAPIKVDQRGISRPNGETCDIGAYEAWTPVDTWFLPFVAGHPDSAAVE